MKKKKFSKFIVTFVIISVYVFTAAILYIFYRTGYEPVAIIGAFFGFATGELWALASIRKTKAKTDATCAKKKEPGVDKPDNKNFI